MSVRRIELVEVSARDGLQNEPEILSTEVKLELIGRAVAAGVRRLEAASFVNPSRVPQMADAEAVMAGLPKDDGVTYIGLVLNRRGFDRAAEAGCREVNYALVASDAFSERNQGTTIEQGMRVLDDIAGAARAAGIRCSATISAAFGCPFQGAVKPERVHGLIAHCAGLGLFEIGIADTIGVAAPGEVATPMVAAIPISNRPTPSEWPRRARWPRCSPKRPGSRPKRSSAGISTTPATPGSPTPSPHSRRGCMPSMRASAVSAAARSPRRRRAIFPPRT